MPVFQLIYASHPFGFDDLTLAAILSTAQRNNTRDGITGALICREDLYMQLLEGEQDVVEAVYERIRRDDRHGEIAKLFSGQGPARLFPTWAMRHDPAKSWMWTSDEVRAGAIARVTPQRALAVFTRLAGEAPGPKSGQQMSAG